MPAPTETTVKFFVVDKVGNNSTCTSTVAVTDTTPPVLEFTDALVPEAKLFAGAILFAETTPAAETARVFYNVPKILDLPEPLIS